MVMVHWRLTLGAVVGLAAWGLAILLGAPAPMRVLIGWNVGALLYLVLAWRLFLTEGEASVRARAARDDERRGVITSLVVLAILAAMSAIVAAQFAVRGGDDARRLEVAGLSGVTIVVSWLVLQTVFVAHYAHRHFQTLQDEPEGFIFPGHAATCYQDFVYLAFCVGATAQVSDPGVATTRLRNLVTAHSVIAFFYNTAILAVGVSILAGLLVR
jgi:uncharacterized membrane protein